MNKIYEMTLMECIDFIRANSVTDEEFEKFLGKSIDDCVSELMDCTFKLETEVKNHFEKKTDPIKDPFSSISTLSVF